MHYTAMLCYRGLGDREKAEREEKLFRRFKAEESSAIDHREAPPHQVPKTTTSGSLYTSTKAPLKAAGLWGRKEGRFAPACRMEGGFLKFWLICAAAALSLACRGR